MPNRLPILRTLGRHPGKLDKAVVLYMPARLNPKQGFRCGVCLMAVKDIGACSILTPASVNLATGVCGLFVPGDPVTSETHPPQQIVPKAIAGYTEDGPTYCGNCRYFRSGGTCAVVAGSIDFFGCCNHWERKGAK